MSQALEDSIAHWGRLARCTSLEAVNKEGIGISSCALCKVFRNEFRTDVCGDCPVAQDTGRENCENTPYEFAVDYINDAAYEGFAWRKWQVVAKAELSYLKELVLQE